MGICCSVTQPTRKFDNENELDKIIIISHSFMKNKLTEKQIEQLLPNLLFTQLIEEKSDAIKYKNFFKWINMSTKYKNVAFSIDITNIINSLKKQKVEENKNNLIDENNNKISLKNSGFSFVENGLRDYYSKNSMIFENRILKSPSGVFRWISWEILCKLPKSKNIQNYEKLILLNISNQKKNEIILEIEEAIEDKCIISNRIKSILFRLLKSLIKLDNEIIILKGITYILAYLLIISDFDEINTFFIIISLLSKTFSEKFGLRGFYIEHQPLLKACNSIFQKNLIKYFPELAEHFQEINISLSSWISIWIQMCYVNVFPNFFLLRVWDYFLVYGIPFLLSLGLSIIEYLYEDLINIDSPEDILELFKKLNPNLKSSNKKIDYIDYNIEDILSHAIKNYPIAKEEINDELQLLFPNYENNFKYQFKDNENTIESGKENSTYFNTKYISDSLQNIGEDNNDSLGEKYLNTFSIIDETYEILEENKIENIELSISQSKKFFENYYSETSCEEIEDENIYIDEHIRDLMNKQTCLNKNSNLH